MLKRENTINVNAIMQEKDEPLFWSWIQSPVGPFGKKETGLCSVGHMHNLWSINLNFFVLKAEVVHCVKKYYSMKA